MRILMLAMGYDVAGQLHALRSALVHERPDWVVDQVRRRAKWLGYPTQHEFDANLVARLWRYADVVHTNLSTLAYRRFGNDRPKPLIVHHHGTEYRDHRAEVDAACRAIGAVQVAATLDLLGSPGVEWLPSVADLNGLRKWRVPRQAGSIVRIAHSPTDREQKGTNDVLAAIERLFDMGLPIEFDLIEGVPWTECLARKGRADIVVDQLTLGYGLSAIEAWGMDIPVVSGAQDPETRRRMVAEFGELPFVEADPTTLAARLAELVTDIRLRREWGQRGRDHAERFHSQRAVVERLVPIYERATMAVAA